MLHVLAVVITLVMHKCIANPKPNPIPNPIVRTCTLHCTSTFAIQNELNKCIVQNN